jgi:hypothetical protein
MKNSVTVTVYKAKWCSHCINFIPELNKLIEMYGGGKKTINDVNVKIKTYWDTDLKGKEGTINGNPISGYPTIKIGLQVGGKSKEYEYTKERTKEKLHMYLNNIINEINKSENEINKAKK